VVRGRRKIQLLITAGEGEGRRRFKILTVEDVLFKQDQFQVKGRRRKGVTIHMKDAPRVGEVITVKVQVKCLS
jgi:hypothetical protein